MIGSDLLGYCPRVLVIENRSDCGVPHMVPSPTQRATAARSYRRHEGAGPVTCQDPTSGGNALALAGAAN